MRRIQYLKRPDLQGHLESLQYLEQKQEEIKIFNLMKKIIERPHRLSYEWLQSNNFVAIPCPDSMDDKEIKMLTNVVNINGLQPMYGACTSIEDDSLYQTYIVKFVNFRHRGFLNYEREFGPWDRVVFSSTCQLVVLLIEEGWHVVAGRTELVNNVLSGSLKKWENDFHEHALYYKNNYSEGFFAYLGDKLIETYDYYHFINKGILDA